MVSTPSLFKPCSHALRAYSGDESSIKETLPSAPEEASMPYFVARKISCRLSGRNANHLPSKSSLSLFARAEPQLVAPISQARSRTFRRSSSELQMFACQLSSYGSDRLPYSTLPHPMLRITAPSGPLRPSFRVESLTGGAIVTVIRRYERKRIMRYCTIDDAVLVLCHGLESNYLRENGFYLSTYELLSFGLISLPGTDV
jgi:hypothetical protein